MGHTHLKRGANGTLVGPDGEAVSSLTDEEEEEEDEPAHRMLAPPDKRLRLLTAGLSRKDRARIKGIPKAMSHSRSLASGATSSLGWAGAGADMLEKKRKEEERRRTIDEKKRVKEVYTQIGAKDWKSELLHGSGQIANVQERLSLCECYWMRIEVASSCIRILLLTLFNVICVLYSNTTRSGKSAGCSPLRRVKAIARLGVVARCHDVACR
jgi:hypothetical protein